MLIANTYGEDVVKRQETIMKLTERNVFLEAETKVIDCRAHFVIAIVVAVDYVTCLPVLSCASQYSPAASGFCCADS